MYDNFYDVFLPQPLVWKPVKGFEGYYEVSNYGNIKSLERYVPVNMPDGSVRRRKVRERIMKNKYDKYGVAVVGLSDEGVVRNWSIHSFMLDAFKNDSLYLEHKDNNYSNNLLWNLATVKSHYCPYKDLKSFSEKDLTEDLLHECFDYHEDGYLVWKKRPPEHFSDLNKYRIFNTINSKEKAGYYNIRTDSKRDDFGYWRVGITMGDNLRHFKLHRLIFAWHYGYFPEVVDHKDGDQQNNKIDNLREGDYQKNSCNLRLNINNTSGYKGVSFNEDRKSRPWKVGIVSEGVSYFVGNFRSAEEAAYAYNLAAKVLHKEFSMLNDVDFKEEDFKPSGKFFRVVYPQLLAEYDKYRRQ